LSSDRIIALMGLIRVDSIGPSLFAAWNPSWERQLMATSVAILTCIERVGNPNPKKAKWRRSARPSWGLASPQEGLLESDQENYQ
jgi:hypothetical protein